MDSYGLYKVRAVVPLVKIGDVSFNSKQILYHLHCAEKEDVDCMVFPELSITSYSCADLFQQQLLIEKAESAVKYLVEESEGNDTLFTVGAPVTAFGKRYNCGIVICNGNILGIVPKSYLPNYGEFYEKRWFDSGKEISGAEINFAGKKVAFGSDLIFLHKGVKIGVEICEDLWVPQPPSIRMAMAGADVILNLSASDENIGKHDYLKQLISQQSARCRCVYVYASAGWGESSTDLVFSGNAMIAENGTLNGEDNRFTINDFSESRIVDIEKLRLDRSRFNTFTEPERLYGDYRHIPSPSISNNLCKVLINDYKNVNPLPFVPDNREKLYKHCEEISNIQSYGLMRRLFAIGCKKAVIGISGGLDSTLALLVTVKAFDSLGLPRNGIIAITMPGLATTSRTRNNAMELMKALGVTLLEIPIGEAVARHFQDIGQDPGNFDATYENSQARERTQILMDIANKENGIVVGTGDMSELALGWCTYNGDHMSMYGVNASVPKTLVKHLVEWYASGAEATISPILRDIIDTPISPELIPSTEDEIAQKTEDLVGPYELHDFFLFHMLRNSFSPKKIFRLALIAFESKYNSETILKWMKVFYRRFFTQQFKRSCMPDGPKVGSVSLSPRGDWRMPSDASMNLWIDQLNEIEPS